MMNVLYYSRGYRVSKMCRRGDIIISDDSIDQPWVITGWLEDHQVTFIAYNDELRTLSGKSMHSKYGLEWKEA